MKEYEYLSVDRLSPDQGMNHHYGQQNPKTAILFKQENLPGVKQNRTIEVLMIDADPSKWQRLRGDLLSQPNVMLSGALRNEASRPIDKR